jgi:hypothetical protein
LMAQSEDLEGQVAARSDERECGDEQGDEEVQHGRAAWSGGGLTSTISRWTVFLGRTGLERTRVLHGNAPGSNTTYRVTLDATRGTEALHFEWTFTTGEASRW